MDDTVGNCICWVKRAGDKMRWAKEMHRKKAYCFDEDI
jgi:hypothetical protein